MWEHTRTCPKGQQKASPKGPHSGSGHGTPRPPRKGKTMDPKQQKAEALDNSRPLYMWRLSDFPEAKAAVDQVFDEVVSAGLVKQRYRSKWRDLTRAIVLDLYAAYKTDPTMYLGYSRNPDNYKVDSVYGAWFLSGTILVKLIDHLHSNGYIEHHAGFHSEGKSRVSRMRATGKLMNVVEAQHKVTVPMVRHNPGEQVIILRDADKNDIEYEDTPEVVRMRENLHRINKGLEKHAILLFIKDEELARLQARLNRKIDFADKRLRRVFNNGSWTQGGRFYGGWWQNVPREYRRHIRINGKDVVECDCHQHAVRHEQAPDAGRRRVPPAGVFQQQDLQGLRQTDAPDHGQLGGPE